MKNFKVIIYIVAGVLMISSFISCSEELAGHEFIGGLEISGKVYDYDFDTPENKGVEDIMLVLSSYESEDRSFKFPLTRDTAYSDASGSFRIKAVTMSEGWKFRLSAEDVQTGRPGGVYHMAPAFNPVLHIEFNRHAYDSEAGVYRMDNIAVPVTKE